MNLIISCTLDCLQPGHVDIDILSWLFTESFIRKCFDMSKRTVDKKGKRAISAFVNQVCGTSVGDVSKVDGECECLLGAIIVCFIILLHLLFYFVYLYF